VTLDGAIEFRVMPARAAEVFVKYNVETNGDAIDEEIISEIITPESRSLCRTGGSKLTGGQFVSGTESEAFQSNLRKSLKENCEKQGVEILAVAITRVAPPQDIAGPVRDREVAKQQLAQYIQEKNQQLSEAQLGVQVLLADQKRKVVEADQAVIEQTTKAEQDNAVAVTLAEQKLKVSQTQLEAARDQASAIISKAKADADVIRFNNTADLAALTSRVSAFDGDGAALARNILVGKLAPGFRSILTNSEGPLMELFGQFLRPDLKAKSTTSPPATETRTTHVLPNPPFATSEAKP
jgi:regulator of protease activity HflC (stomatin/prohibitin superfamily)